MGVLTPSTGVRASIVSPLEAQKQVTLRNDSLARYSFPKHLLKETDKI